MIEIPANLLAEITALPKPLIIGISGVGGAGKSSVAHALAEAVKAPVVGVDSFQKNRTAHDYALWNIMDYERLEQEVIKPFVEGATLLRYGHFDWATNGVALEKEVLAGDILIIEVVGLFRPELNRYFGYKIWVDCPKEEATARGKKRDREEYNNPQDESWDGVWKRNDAEYFEAFQPRAVADLIFKNY